MPKTKPCINFSPPEGLNMTGITAGRWYVSKMFCDLMQSKPEVASMCVFIDISNQGPEELSINMIQQGVFKNLTGVLNGKNYGEFSGAFNIPGNPPSVFAVKTQKYFNSKLF